MLHVGSIEHPHRIAIGDAHDLAGERLGGGRDRRERDDCGEESHGRLAELLGERDFRISPQRLGRLVRECGQAVEMQVALVPCQRFGGTLRERGHAVEEQVALVRAFFCRRDMPKPATNPTAS